MAFNKKYTASSTQTIPDLALQLHGSVDKAIEMIEQNPDLVGVNENPTSIEISYELNNSFVQKNYIAGDVKVATKPVNYYNTDSPAILANDSGYLLQENGYKILI